MEALSLAPWTLGVRRDGDALEFNLGDGRRLAWRCVRAAGLLGMAKAPMQAADLLGAELAGHLARRGQLSRLGNNLNVDGPTLRVRNSRNGEYDQTKNNSSC